jgi:hypothetical protein
MWDWNWSTILTEVVAAAVTITTIWRMFKARDPKLASEVPKDVQTVLDDGVHLVQEVAKVSPTIHAEEQKAQVLGCLAARGLAAFSGAPLGTLTDIQKAALFRLVEEGLENQKISVSPDELRRGIEREDRIIAGIQASVVKSVQALDAALNVAKATTK